MYNKVVLVGNLTRDVEMKYAPSGSAIGNVGIAASRKYKAKNGEQKEEVMFIDLTFFGRTAEVANQYLRKGSKVLVDGRLAFQQWTAKDGTKRSKHTITVDVLQMLGSKNDSESQPQRQSQPQQGYGEAQQQGFSQPKQGHAGPADSQPTQPRLTNSNPDASIDEDEIPF